MMFENPQHSKFYILNSRKGQTTIEILIALSILTLAMSAVILVISTGQSLTLDSSEGNKALTLARDNLESVESIARYNFNGIVSSTSTQGEFTKQLIVEILSADTKRITSRVTWSTDPKRTQQVELVTDVTDSQDVAGLGGDTGGTGTLGNWQSPQTFGTIDLGPGNSATGLDVLNKIVYVSATASDPKKPDFFIIDATNGSSPTILSSLNTGPGLNAVDAITNYSYVANSDTNAQLQIIDTHDLHNPTTTTSFKLPGVSGSGAAGNSIFYYASRIYMGTKQANGPELHIIDVSDPKNPVELASREINADVNAIYVSGSRVYLATSDDNAEVQILNVSSTSPVSATTTLLGTYNATGTEDGKSLYLAGSKLYFGRVSNSDPEFSVLDVSNPASIKFLGSQTLGADVNDIFIRDNLAFLATSDSNREFQVWNIQNPASITLWSYFNFPQVGTDIDYENNVVYMAVRSNDALRIITSQ